VLRSAVIALVVLAACSARRDEAPRPEERDPDTAALARATAMVARGTQCDRSAPTPDIAACTEACELNHSNSCAWLGEAYERGAGVAQNLPRAREFFHRACRGGSGLGCEGEARCLARGLDTEEAARLLREARIVYRVHCGQRHAISCVRLAALYAEGRGGPADPGVALTYRQKACALGETSACP
jgi:hypothetical protein